jgi:hypothetical protein
MYPNLILSRCGGKSAVAICKIAPDIFAEDVRKHFNDIRCTVRDSNRAVPGCIQHARCIDRNLSTCTELNSACARSNVVTFSIMKGTSVRHMLIDRGRFQTSYASRNIQYDHGLLV